jgi:DNA-binding NarL/FixJ family response regulator
MSTIRLFIASDYAMTRDGIRSILTTRTQDISVAGEAESVAESPLRVRTVAADAILVDASAPAADALRAVGSIVREYEQPKIAVLTNIAEAGFVRSMLAAGVLGYVLKHSSTEQLIAAIRKVAAGRRFLDPLLSDALVGELLPRKRIGAVEKCLSHREQDVLKGIARGFSNRQLADRLSLSTKTVETYRGRLYHKLHLHDRAELVNYAIAIGLLSPTPGY